MDYITIIGLTAGALTTVAFLPQVVKIRRSRSSGDISLLMISLQCSGVFMWLLYGIGIGSLPIIAANGVTFLLLCAALVLAIKHRQ
ncbi:MAG TPA: SemiSWEET transporter [Syntrophorhabdaceae bacterium]|jgi:MtN3 and saliva related transmembrane protein